jgi:hypothetical protein
VNPAPDRTSAVRRLAPNQAPLKNIAERRTKPVA